MDDDTFNRFWNLGKKPEPWVGFDEKDDGLALRTVTYDDEKFALVPLEPCKKMIDAGEQTLEANTEYGWDSGPDGEGHNDYQYYNPGHVRAVFLAMVSAAAGVSDDVR